MLWLKVIGIGFFALLLLALIRRKRDRETLEMWDEVEETDERYGFGAVEDADQAYDPEAWRGDLHTDDDDWKRG